MGHSCLTANTRLSLLCCHREADQREGDYKTGEVSRGLADHEAGRMVLSKQVPANEWVLFPRPLIFSDYAVVAGLRLGGSQGKMPTLLLGCLP